MSADRNKTHISEEAALALLKLFFDGVAQDFVSVEHMIAVKNRNALDDVTNRKWLTGVTAKMKNHGFIKRINDLSGRNRLLGINLTPVGKVALANMKSIENISPHKEPTMTSNATSNDEDLSLDNLLTHIEKLRVKHTSFEIIFTIRHKDANTGMDAAT